MVERVTDAWQPPGGHEGQRIGAMMWRRHAAQDGEREQRPLPHLAVMTPAGLVCLDCPTSDDPNAYWTRTGEPPDVTVTPSLDVDPGGQHHWHGFLTAGQLA